MIGRFFFFLVRSFLVSSLTNYCPPLPIFDTLYKKKFSSSSPNDKELLLLRKDIKIQYKTTKKNS